MPVNNDQYIDNYLLNKLSDKERMDFENKLSKNEDFQEEVELRRNIIKGAKNLGRDKMKERLKNIHKEVNKPPTIRRRIWPFISGVAAAIALLVVSWTYFSTNTDNSPQGLFAANYQPYELSLTSRDNTTEEIAELNALYNNKEYKATLPLFEKALKQNPNDARMLLGSGISLLELGELEKSRNYLIRILVAQDLRLSNTANWYIAMSYLKEGKAKEARNALVTLIDNPMADRHKEAVLLSKALSSTNTDL
jgi:tetratricopeptide (TPR) repeat protein